VLHVQGIEVKKKEGGGKRWGLTLWRATGAEMTRTLLSPEKRIREPKRDHWDVAGFLG
jgi:hypothetical protein